MPANTRQILTRARRRLRDARPRIRAIYVVRNPDKLRGFLEHTH